MCLSCDKARSRSLSEDLRKLPPLYGFEQWLPPRGTAHTKAPSTRSPKEYLRKEGFIAKLHRAVETPGTREVGVLVSYNMIIHEIIDIHTFCYIYHMSISFYLGHCLCRLT